VALPIKVRDAMKRIEAAGWEFARMRGSHRHLAAATLRLRELDDLAAEHCAPHVQDAGTWDQSAATASRKSATAGSS